MQRKNSHSYSLPSLAFGRAVVVGALGTLLATAACGSSSPTPGKRAQPQAKRQATGKVPAQMAGKVMKAKAVTKTGKAKEVPIVNGTFTFEFFAEPFVIVFVDLRGVVVANLQMPEPTGAGASDEVALIPYAAFSATYFAANPVFDFGTINVDITTHIATSTINIFTVLDTDGDGTVDFDDTDDDDDGVLDFDDEDLDGDGEIDEDDDMDLDDDGLCDMADPDDDGDGSPDDEDSDDDGDGIDDEIDFDSDEDSIGDDLDSDDDNDGVDDTSDTDDDGDGINDAEQDDDGDGIPDYRDSDSDGDGMPNDADTDDDGDGLPDDDEE